MADFPPCLNDKTQLKLELQCYDILNWLIPKLTFGKLLQFPFKSTCFAQKLNYAEYSYQTTLNVILLNELC